jgi:excisionase family DNA binding protein
VVDTAQEVKEYLGSVWHASDSTRLAVKKAELDRRTERIAREYAAYNAQCEALDRAEWSQTQGAGVPEHPVLNSLFPYNNYRPQPEANVGPNNAAPNVLYYNPNTGALFNAPPMGPPNPATFRQAPVQQYVPAQSAPTTYAPQQLPTAPANYAPVQYAPFQYGVVPNANANYAPVTAPSSQATQPQSISTAMSTNELPELMTIAEVAEMLQCTDRHIYRLEKDRKMPKALRPGALVRFRRKLIIEWIEAGCPMRDALPAQDMKVEMTPEEATTHPETECDLPYIKPEEPGYPFAGQHHRTSIGALLGAPYTDFSKVRLTTLCQITGCQWEHMQQFILEGNELPTHARQMP